MNELRVLTGTTALRGSYFLSVMAFSPRIAKRFEYKWDKKYPFVDGFAVVTRSSIAFCNPASA